MPCGTPYLLQQLSTYLATRHQTNELAAATNSRVEKLLAVHAAGAPAALVRPPFHRHMVVPRMQDRPWTNDGLQLGNRSHSYPPTMRRLPVSLVSAEDTATPPPTVTSSSLVVDLDRRHADLSPALQAQCEAAATQIQRFYRVWKMVRCALVTLEVVPRPYFQKHPFGSHCTVAQRKKLALQRTKRDIHLYSIVFEVMATWYLSHHATYAHQLYIDLHWKQQFVQRELLDPIISDIVDRDCATQLRLYLSERIRQQLLSQMDHESSSSGGMYGASYGGGTGSSMGASSGSSTANNNHSSNSNSTMMQSMMKKVTKSSKQGIKSLWKSMMPTLLTTVPRAGETGDDEAGDGTEHGEQDGDLDGEGDNK